MHEAEWRLVYPGVDLTFGGFTEYPIVAPPDLGESSPETQDNPYPYADGTQVGRDYRPGRTIAFEIGVNRFSNTEGLDAHGSLARAWRGDSIRKNPGAVATLHAMHGGRERVVFGRPRRYAPVLMDNESGYSGVTCDFQCSDDLWYDAAETNVSIGLYAPTSGGITAPITGPITRSGAVRVAGGLQAGGLVDGWRVVAIEGAPETPGVELVGLWSREVTTALAFGQCGAIDTRPGARSVVRRDGASVGGKL